MLSDFPGRRSRCSGILLPEAGFCRICLPIPLTDGILAELCGQYLSKGRSILVEGRLQMDSWEKDGVKHSKLKVRASTIKFLPMGDRLNGGPQNRQDDMPGSPSPLESDPDDIPF